ncbi:hypothetical protein Ahu01nite_052400 [Winogradskya humida]|uniref:Uncharacterized protein n=1 Tax=Winogradskya humida TaxID=113566 RepID=A0ABQ3ZU90_9ACTN|nr:hypothetical protein Ahu01nite_052400 [Actinoplanes humidus]
MALAEGLWLSLAGWHFARNFEGNFAVLSDIELWSVAAQGALMATMEACWKDGCVLPQVERVLEDTHVLTVPLDGKFHRLLFDDKRWRDGHLVALHAFTNRRRKLPPGVLVVGEPALEPPRRAPLT